MKPPTAATADPDTPTEPALPLYVSVKQHIQARIREGEWLPNQQIPPEHQLVAELGLSRMTIHRALRELAQEGFLTRLQGVGTFVASPRVQTSIFEIRNIADEIAERGQRHSARVVVQDRVRASPQVAEALQVDVGREVFYSVIVHAENDIPVELEERHVNPATAPDYLRQDFARATPNSYLSAVAPWTDAEHEIEAILPQAWEARLLSVARGDPCLQVWRRTWMVQTVVTTVRLLVPSQRMSIKSGRREPQK